MGRVLAEVLLAMLVTLGVIALIQWVKRMLWTPPQITAAVTVRSAHDLENLDILLSEAMTSDARRRDTPVVVLIASSLLSGTAGRGRVLPPAVQEMIDTYGAVWYVIEDQ